MAWHRQGDSGVAFSILTELLIAYCILKILYLYLHCAPLSPIVSHYFKPHLLSPGLPDEHVNFQATSSMSPWVSLVASDSNQ